ncbi:MAG: Nramp family divalent metal transporter [Nitrospirota bacterium]
MSFWRKVVIFLSIMGPGIISANVDHDASGITTYSVAGARFGYSIIWLLLPTTIVLAVVQEMVARMGVVTGKGLSDLIREHYGIKATFYMMIALFLANFGTTIANFAGVAASMEIIGLSRYVMVPLGAVSIWILVMQGSYRSVEKILLLACLLYFGYVIAGFLAEPPWGVVLKNAVTPQVQWNPEYIILSIGIIGTTVTPWMQFFLQSSIAEKGVRKSEYHATKLDVYIGCALTEVIAFFIIVTCATTLFAYNIRVHEAHEAALALRPLAGNYASLIFAISLANASLLGAIIVPLATSYFICEAMGWERGLNKTFKEAPQFMGIYTFMIVLAALLILIPGAPLVFLMILSSVLNGLLLPFVLLYALSLINNKNIMGEYVNHRPQNIVAWSTVVALTLLTVVFVLSLLIPIGDIHG